MLLLLLSLTGSLGHRTLRTKGAQTFGLLRFLVEELRAFRTNALFQRYADAAESLVLLVEHWASCGAQLSASQIERSWELFLRFSALTADFDDQLISKRHVTLHLLRKSPLHGNQLMSANWLDESLNKMLKQSCRTVSQSTFDAHVLTHVRERLMQAAKNSGAKRKFEA